MLLRPSTVFLAALILACPDRGAAQTPAADPAAPRVSFSGYVQPQYEIRASDGETSDRTLIRRMVISLDVSAVKGWHAQLQLDAGPLASGGDRLLVKNAILQYGGWRDQGITLTIGNQKVPFSRSVLGASSRRGLIERPFTGDRAFGSPGRALSVKADGWHRRNTIYWSGAVASVRQSPDAGEIRLEGSSEAGSGWNEGPLVGGRVELHPRGEVPRDHSDFARGPLRLTVGAGGYSWWNDNDVERHGAGTVDARRVRAFEISGGLRGAGLTVEAEFERIAAAAVDSTPTLGLYRGGRLALTKSSIETGYMFLPGRLEGLAGADRLAAEAFDHPWRRVFAGLNVYVNGHQTKFSLMHRESFNDRGLEGVRSRATYLQTQFAF